MTKIMARHTTTFITHATHKTYEHPDDKNYETTQTHTTHKIFGIQIRKNEF